MVWLAAGSPLVTLDHQLLTFHMVKHLLLMTVAAPLILWGTPALLFKPAAPPAAQMVRTRARLILAGRHGDRDWLAYSGRVRTGAPIACVAFRRKRDVSAGWPIVLVAGDRALAWRGNSTALVRANLPVSRHHALRYSLGVSRVLRPRCLPVLSFRPANFWPICSR